MQVRGIGHGHRSESRRRIGLDKADGRCRSDDMSRVISGEYDVDGLVGSGALSDCIEDFGDRCAGRQAQKIGRHEATGGLRVVTEECADLSLLGLWQQVQDR